VTAFERWKTWYRARQLLSRARYRRWRIASLADQRRAQRIEAKVVRWLEPSSGSRSVLASPKLRGRAARLTCLCAAPPLPQLWAWLAADRRRALQVVLPAIALCLAAVAWQLRVELHLVRDLTQGRTWQTSSRLDVPGPYAFHTGFEPSPSASIDLGAPRRFSQLFLENRVDCCQMRAIPLLVEVSNDNARWQAVARRDTPFEHARLSFATVSGRYLRLRVGRPSYLHLAKIGLFR